MEAARLWNEAIRYSFVRIGSPHDIIVHYESFVQSPERVLHAVCHHIGVEFERGMVDITDGSPIVEPGEPWKRDVNSTVRMSENKFYDVLTEKDRRRVARVLDWPAYNRLLGLRTDLC